MVEKAQRASDSAARFSRKQTLEYAESMNIQRELIYAQRNHLINQDQDLTDTIEQVLDDYIDIALVEEDLSEKEKLYHFILKNISFILRKFQIIWILMMLKLWLNLSISLLIGK